MARQIYSFTKIEKKRTNAGIITCAVGAASVLGLAALIIGAVVCRGNMPFGVAALGMVSFIVAIGSFMAASGARKDDDTFGRFIQAGYVISGISVGLHILVILMGILAIII